MTKQSAVDYLPLVMTTDNYFTHRQVATEKLTGLLGVHMTHIYPAHVECLYMPAYVKMYEQIIVPTRLFQVSDVSMAISIDILQVPLSV